MHLNESIRKFIFTKNTRPSLLQAAQAYDIWSGSYDQQPGNLMLALDEEIFSGLISGVDLENKVLADIGCGTGRHWQKLFDRAPASITGYDVSKGMLERLKLKYPAANTRLINDRLPGDIAAASVDCILSTLTIAHIRNLQEAAKSWEKILKPGGDLLITDFHPALLVSGGKRSFRHNEKTLAVVNYIHPLDDVKRIFIKMGFMLADQNERFIDKNVRAYYEKQDALDVYERFKGMPVIYGLHLKKANQ